MTPRLSKERWRIGGRYMWCTVDGWVKVHTALPADMTFSPHRTELPTAAYVTQL